MFVMRGRGKPWLAHTGSPLPLKLPIPFPMRFSRKDGACLGYGEAASASGLRKRGHLGAGQGSSFSVTR